MGSTYVWMGLYAIIYGIQLACYVNGYRACTERAIILNIFLICFILTIISIQQ